MPFIFELPENEFSMYAKWTIIIIIGIVDFSLIYIIKTEENKIKQIDSINK